MRFTPPLLTGCGDATVVRGLPAAVLVYQRDRNHQDDTTPAPARLPGTFLETQGVVFGPPSYAVYTFAVNTTLSGIQLLHLTIDLGSLFVGQDITHGDTCCIPGGEETGNCGQNKRNHKPDQRTLYGKEEIKRESKQQSPDLLT